MSPCSYGSRSRIPHDSAVPRSRVASPSQAGVPLHLRGCRNQIGGGWRGNRIASRCENGGDGRGPTRRAVAVAVRAPRTDLTGCEMKSSETHGRFSWWRSMTCAWTIGSGSVFLPAHTLHLHGRWHLTVRAYGYRDKPAGGWLSRLGREWSHCTRIMFSFPSTYKAYLLCEILTQLLERRVIMIVARQ